MRLSVAEVRNLHPARRPDRLLTTAGLARGVQRRAEAPGFGLRRAEVPAGRPVKPALSISVQTKRPSFRMHTSRRVTHDTLSLRSFRRRSRHRSSARSTCCSRCAQLKKGRGSAAVVPTERLRDETRSISKAMRVFDQLGHPTTHGLHSAFRLGEDDHCQGCGVYVGVERDDDENL